MRVVVVTGANKGIGYAIVKGLCKKLDGGIIYLTARNEDLGHQAIQSIEQELAGEKNCEIRFHRMDLTDSKSIDVFAAHLKKEHGGLDILVNNAGIAFKMSSPEPFEVQAEVTNATNFFGTLAVCRKIFPILRPHARVVNVASQAGLLRSVPGEKIRETLSSPTLKMDELCALANRFVAAAKEGTHKDQGFAGSAYGMSKVFENAMTEIQQRDFDADKREDLIVNSCCPGFVDTDMTSHKGHLTPEEGADTPVYLALIPPGAAGPKGKFVYKRNEMDWKAVV